MSTDTMWDNIGHDDDTLRQAQDVVERAGADTLKSMSAINRAIARLLPPFESNDAFCNVADAIAQALDVWA